MLEITLAGHVYDLSHAIDAWQSRYDQLSDFNNMLHLRFHVKNQSVIVSGSLSFALHVHFTQALCQAVYYIGKKSTAFRSNKSSQF